MQKLLDFGISDFSLEMQENINDQGFIVGGVYPDDFVSLKVTNEVQTYFKKLLHVGFHFLNEQTEQLQQSRVGRIGNQFFF